MLLARLQSGVLLFETQQGLVQVELSPWQRAHLLWTFRNFRHLSISLLNLRQRALLTDLFANGARVAPDSPDPSLVIGVVVDFVPPTERTSEWPSQKKGLQEKTETPLGRPEGPPNAQRVAPSFSTTALFRIATAAGVLCLASIAVVSWHRIQERPGFQAHAQPRPPDKVANRRGSSDSRSPRALAQNPRARPVETTARRHTVPKSAIHAASITAVIPIAKQRPGLQSDDPTPTIQLSGQDRSIQASRAPVHLVYPVHPDVPNRGVVALTARVDSGGAVRSVSVVSGQRVLAAAAVHAVRQWRYSPYLKDGAPVATETNIRISFVDDAISLCFTPERALTLAQNPRTSLPVAATAPTPSLSGHPPRHRRQTARPSARRHTVPKSAVHAASFTAVIPVAKQQPGLQSDDPSPTTQLSGQDRSIQTSRAPVHVVYPVYPDIPIRGVVALTARVDSGGAVRSVSVVSGQRVLAAAAVHAVRQWRYSPYLENGEPVATETNIRISFFSKDAISVCFLGELPPADGELTSREHSEKLK